MEREVGGGIGMGITRKPMAISFQCMTKSTKIKKNAHILIYKCKTVTIVTNTTDQSTIRNKMTKEFKIFKELTICGKGTRGEYTMLGKWCHRHVQCMITINFQFVMKHSICEPLLHALQCFKSMPVNQLKQVMKRD